MRVWRMLVAGIVAGLVSLALLTVLHRKLGRLSGWDAGCQAAVHGWSANWLTFVMLALTFVGKIEVFLPATAIGAACLAATQRKRSAILLVFAVGGALLLNEALKLHFHRSRPAVAWSIHDESTYSFPSGHALFATVLYGMLAYLLWQAGQRGWVVPALLMPVAIGLSRIYLGMHFPTDVLAGYLAGLVWLLGIVAGSRDFGRPLARTAPVALR